MKWAPVIGAAVALVVVTIVGYTMQMESADGPGAVPVDKDPALPTAKPVEAPAEVFLDGLPGTVPREKAPPPEKPKDPAPPPEKPAAPPASNDAPVSIPNTGSSGGGGKDDPPSGRPGAYERQKECDMTGRQPMTKLGSKFEIPVEFPPLAERTAHCSAALVDPSAPEEVTKALAQQAYRSGLVFDPATGEMHYDPARPRGNVVVYHSHIHKAGGTTFCNLGKSNACVTTGENCNTKDDLAETITADGPIIRSPQGNDFLASEDSFVMDQLDSPVVLKTIVVRDPIRRLISNMGIERYKAGMNAKDKLKNNLLTAFLVGRRSLKSPKNAKEHARIVEQAKKTLRSMSVIILHDRYEEGTCLLLPHMLGWENASTLPVGGRIWHAPSDLVDVLGQEMYDEAVKANSLDYEVIAYAECLYAEMVERARKERRPGQKDNCGRTY